MVSCKVNFLTVFLFLKAYHASAFVVGQPYTDVVVPIPEVSLTIGGTMTAYPIQQEELFYEQYEQYPLGYLPSYQQQPQVIILDDAGKKNNMNPLFLLLLLGKGGSSNGCANCCPCACCCDCNGNCANTR